MRRMFDQIGGVGKLVSGKTVAIKINMANPLQARTGHRAAWYTRWSHPDVIGAAVQLFGRAGASRIRILESSTEDDNPLEENFVLGGWDPAPLLKAAPRVEMENTGGLGYGKKYYRLTCPAKPYIYPAFDVNHSYAECDVLVSIAKLKEHQRAGRFALDGEHGRDRAGNDLRRFGAPTKSPRRGRSARARLLYLGHRQPSATAPPEIDPNIAPGIRLPRSAGDRGHRARPGRSISPSSTASKPRPRGRRCPNPTPSARSAW